jgi:hypothetical protein
MSSPQSQLPLPQELVKTPLLQMVPVMVPHVPSLTQPVPVWHWVGVQPPPAQSAEQLVAVSPQSQNPSPQEGPKVPLAPSQRWAGFTGSHWPFTTQMFPERQVPATQPQSWTQPPGASPQSQVPLPQESWIVPAWQ